MRFSGLADDPQRWLWAKVRCQSLKAPKSPLSHPTSGMLIRRKPGVCHSADYRGLLGQAQMSDGLAGERVRQQGKFIALNLTPAAAVSVVMPDQVDRTRTDRGPARHL